MSDQSIQITDSMAEGATTSAVQQTIGTVVELTIPADGFVLAETLDSVPDAEFACERVVESGYETVLPLIWACGVERDELEAAFASDPSVESASLLTGAENRWLYQMQWDSTIEFLAGIAMDPRATIVDLSGPDPCWSLHLLYSSRDEVSESLEYYETHDIPFEINAIRELSNNRGQDGRLLSDRRRASENYGLSAKQAESLRFAYEYGHFEIPRETAVQDLADEFDVSHQALSERLRRGSEALIKNTLMAESVFEEPRS